MGESGVVVKLEDNNVIVKLTRTEACSKCKACSAGENGKDMFITAENQCGATINDTVNVELASKVFIKALLIMYGVPFTFMVTGFSLGIFAANSIGQTANAEVIGFFTGVVFLLLAYLGIRKMESRWRKDSFLPVASSILNNKQ